MKEFLMNLSTFNFGLFSISGRNNLNYNLWNKEYRVRVFLKYFLVYEKKLKEQQCKS